MQGNSKLLLFLSLTWALVILVLGLWWLYLIVNLSEQLRPLLTSHPELLGGRDVMKMVKWEGGSFLILLILLSIGLLFLYFKDQRKTKSLQAFFASLTHELKTPLASIRLQAEVLNELIHGAHGDPKPDQLLLETSERMIEDTATLEHQMDKILQLSRIERGGKLSFTPIEISRFLREIVKSQTKDLAITIKVKNNLLPINGDEFALKLILKNLFENTKKHTKNCNVTITLEQISLSILKLTYQDTGSFAGNNKKLGSLFYKFNSPKGSGIGLYLCKKLTQAMNGKINIATNADFFTIELLFNTDIKGIDHDPGNTHRRG